MSKNDVVAIFKFRTTDGRVKYYVYYEHGNADVIDSMTFAMFREFVKGKKLASKLKTAKTLAAQLQKENIPEYLVVVYDGYFNAFSAEHGYPTPSTGLQFKSNPVYLGLGEGDYVYDVRDELDCELCRSQVQNIVLSKCEEPKVRATRWASRKAGKSNTVVPTNNEELVQIKEELARSKLEVEYLKREVEALKQRAIIRL
jgi:hypothetical protein